MGTVLDLGLRLPHSGDWTASERATLWSVAERLPDQASGVEVVFGMTDLGDPWCVITDGNDEVLLHVARIRGRFVVHAPAEGTVAEGPDLRSPLNRVWGASEEQRRSNVTPFQPTVLPPHALAAFEAANHDAAEPVDLFGSRHEEQPAEAPAAPPQPLETLADLTPAETRADPVALPPEPELATVVALWSDQFADLSRGADEPAPLETNVVIRPAETAVVALATPSAAPVLAEAQMRAALDDHRSLGPETLIGGAGADTLVGGDGDDLIDGKGAPDAEVDVLDGGEGEDRLMLGPNVVAIGGKGPDVFVVTAIAKPAGPPAPLGIVVDFFAGNDERLEFGPEARVTIVDISPEADVLASVRNRPELANAPVVAGARLTLDVDGDGHEDGYVLLGGIQGPRPMFGLNDNGPGRNFPGLLDRFDFGPASTASRLHPTILTVHQVDELLYEAGLGGDPTPLPGGVDGGVPLTHTPLTSSWTNDGLRVADIAPPLTDDLV